MARRLYSILYYLLLPAIVLRQLWRGLRARKGRGKSAWLGNLAARFGHNDLPQFTHQPIWIHAVSVGESIAAAPLVWRLLERYPRTPIVISTMTHTGAARVQALFQEQLNHNVFHCYMPYDLPHSQKRFISRMRPKLAIMMETELWPNTLQCCQREGVPVILANARLSAKSARGYQRVSALMGGMLRQLTLLAAQTEADAQRFCALGAPSNIVTVVGSIKYDISIEPALRDAAEQLRAQILASGTRPIWIAASTHEGEEGLLLQAQKAAVDRGENPLLILIPRHPERFDKVEQLVLRMGLTLQRRSTQQHIAADTEVMLGDTMGEMLLLLGVGDLAFFGGSLVARGGHNMLEAAAWGLPILSGPSIYNFQGISEKLQAAGALQWVHAEEDFVPLLGQLISDEHQRETMGRAALEVVEQNRGALAELERLITTQIKSL